MTNPSLKKCSASKFLTDLDNGKAGEVRTARTIKTIENAEEIQHVDEGKAYDFICTFKDKSPIYYEVKSDFMAARTNNIFLEYCCNNKNSGLAATEAHKWAILLPHLKEIFVFAPDTMWEHLQKSRYRQVSGGDGNRASGFIVPIETVRGLDFVTAHTEIV